MPLNNQSGTSLPVLLTHLDTTKQEGRRVRGEGAWMQKKN
jgi:hypothetical protein